MSTIDNFIDDNYFIQHFDEFDTKFSIERLTRFINEDEKNGRNSSPTYYRARAGLYLRLEEYITALPDYDKAVKLDPDDPQVYFERSIAYIAIGKLQEAINDICRAYLMLRFEINEKHDEIHELAREAGFPDAIEEYHYQLELYCNTFFHKYPNKILKIPTMEEMGFSPDKINQNSKTGAGIVKWEDELGNTIVKKVNIRKRI